MTLSMTKNETQVFYEVLMSELKCLINEYDDDTGRCPSKKRMANKPCAQAIMTKWENTQNKIPKTQLINLTNIIPCTLDLTDKETKYIKDLLSKDATELRKTLKNHPTPYVGMLNIMDKIATTEENITNRL